MSRSACADGRAMFTIDASRMIISCAAASTTSAHHRPGSGAVPPDEPSAEGRTGSLITTPHIVLRLPASLAPANHEVRKNLPDTRMDAARASPRLQNEANEKYAGPATTVAH